MKRRGDSENDSDEYKDAENISEPSRQSRKKRRKVNSDTAQTISGYESSNAFKTALIFDGFGNGDPMVESFQDIMDHLLPDFLRSRATLQDSEIEIDDRGQKVRPLTRYEMSSLSNRSTSQLSSSAAIIVRKLKLIWEKRLANLPQVNLQASQMVTPLPAPPSSVPPHPQVLDALYNIQTTPFGSSFLSRLQGTMALPTSVIAEDWETVTPWMSLMNDIREHYILAHPDREPPMESSAPITYTSLQACHLQQVHDLLERVFWSGINVSDSLDHSPERCTVVATYKRLVVGIAILSSPRETYITYLAVKAGWDNAGIARSMLYHLIKLNPHQDITLHVSVNSSAMLLYNRFGFKAEGFVAGFYEDYLDPLSRASKNAFRLRLRQQ